MSELFDPRQVGESFTKAAHQYDSFANIQKYAEAELLDRIQLMKLAPKKILDIGCGVGTLTRALKKLFPKAEIFGVDISEGMIQQAQSQNGWFKKNDYQVSAAEALPFDDDQFDLVVSNFMLHWCDNPDLVFAEANRVLKKDALLFMTSLGPNTLQEFRNIWQEIDEYPHIHPFLDMHLLGDGLLKQGFSDPVIDREDQVIYYATSKDAIHSLKRIGAQNQLKERRRTLTGKSRLEQFIDLYENMKTSKGFPVSYEIVYMHARGGSLDKKSGEFYVSIESLKQTLP